MLTHHSQPGVFVTCYAVCAAGKFSLPGSTTCTDCPVGSTSTAGSTGCSCTAGYALSGGVCTGPCPHTGQHQRREVVPNCVSSLACSIHSAQLARQARSANLALPALVRLHALARPSILTDPLTPRSCLLRARFSLHRWLVQRRPGQHVHVVPEQQCERGELVDVHLRRWLLPGWQRLLARMHQYVVVHSCVPRPSWKAHSVPRPSSLRPSSPCPSSPRPSSPRPSSPRPSSPRSDSLQRQHVQRDRRFGDLHCLPRGQHEQCWRDGMHLHRRLLERWQRQLPRLHRYVRCLHGSRAQLATY